MDREAGESEHEYSTEAVLLWVLCTNLGTSHALISLWLSKLKIQIS